MVHEIGVLQCTCDDIFGMISLLPNFHQSYLMFLKLNIHQKNTKMTPNTTFTTLVAKISIQNKVYVHFTRICVHGLIFCTQEAFVVLFLCPIFFCPAIRSRGSRMTGTHMGKFSKVELIGSGLYQLFVNLKCS